MREGYDMTRLQYSLEVRRLHKARGMSRQMQRADVTESHLRSSEPFYSPPSPPPDTLGVKNIITTPPPSEFKCSNASPINH